MWVSVAGVAVMAAGLLVVFTPGQAFAATYDIPTVIDNTRNWIIGICAGLATLFLTIGGLRYLMAGGDPGEVEKAKGALKAAAIGYGIAILSPILLTVLQGIVGTDPAQPATPLPPVRTTAGA